MASIKLVILDRDGVINYDSEKYIKSPQEWLPIPGSLEAIKKLNQAGIKVGIATNQSGIARGYYNEPMLEQIHLKMKESLEKIEAYIDIILFCPHHPNEQCDCRKPKPDMLIKISKFCGISLDQAVMIGDKITDIQAGQSAGTLKNIYINHDLELPLNIAGLNKNNLQIYKSLSHAVDALL